MDLMLPGMEINIWPPPPYIFIAVFMTVIFVIGLFFILQKKPTS